MSVAVVEIGVDIPDSIAAKGVGRQEFCVQRESGMMRRGWRHSLELDRSDHYRVISDGIPRTSKFNEMMSLYSSPATVLLASPLHEQPSHLYLIIKAYATPPTEKPHRVGMSVFLMVIAVAAPRLC